MQWCGYNMETNTAHVQYCDLVAALVVNKLQFSNVVIRCRGSANHVSLCFHLGSLHVNRRIA